MPDSKDVELPQFHELFSPVLKTLDDLGGSATNQEIERAVADHMDFTEEQISVQHDTDSGDQTELDYRLAWARTYLKDAGYLTNVERGKWALTADGRTVEIDDPMKIVYEVKRSDDEAAMDAEQWNELAEKAMGDTEPPVRSVRELLSIFGHSRRGKHVIRRIKNALREKGLKTWPRFDSAHIDARIEIVPVDDAEESAGEVEPENVDDIAPVDEDPVPRLAQLQAADREPVSVNRDDRLNRATTLMLQNDFSQLPVMQSERNLNGYISWETIGENRVTDGEPEYVREVMAPNPRVLSANTPLMQAVAEIQKHEFVLVEGAENKIRGPVTTFDITNRFRKLAEPFLRVGEIEGQLRRLVSRLPTQRIQDAQDPQDTERTVESVTDLTFGEHVRLLENEDNWQHLGLNLDRRAVVKRMHRVREIRNRVMHFEPDGISEADSLVLHRTSGFLKRLMD